jgi:hypothetical protein
MKNVAYTFVFSRTMSTVHQREMKNWAEENFSKVKSSILSITLFSKDDATIFRLKYCDLLNGEIIEHEYDEDNTEAVNMLTSGALLRWSGLKF